MTSRTTSVKCQITRSWYQQWNKKVVRRCLKTKSDSRWRWSRRAVTCSAHDRMRTNVRSSTHTHIHCSTGKAEFYTIHSSVRVNLKVSVPYMPFNGHFTGHRRLAGYLFDSHSFLHLHETAQRFSHLAQHHTRTTKAPPKQSNWPFLISKLTSSTPTELEIKITSKRKPSNCTQSSAAFNWQQTFKYWTSTVY